MPQSTFDRHQQAKINVLARRIRKIYEDAITKIVFHATALPLKGELFDLTNYPAILKRINLELAKIHKGIYTVLINGITDSWNLSNEKNNLLVDKRLAGRLPVLKVKQILYDPNHDALSAFIKRKEKGLNLSERVWNSLDPFKKELEQGLGIGLGKGQSAPSLAGELKRYLKEPDRLFRRVRGKDGELHLSKAERDYHPGQGVYRSSYQNAYRLARTETNLSYRSSDHERWQRLPFVVGIEVRTSNTHGAKDFDICDKLQGKYPKDFKFSGWHPACKCNSISIQMTDEEYDKYEDSILSGTRVNIPSANTVNDVPKAFDSYLDTNKKQIKGWANAPYWVKDNTKYAKL